MNEPFPVRWSREAREALDSRPMAQWRRAWLRGEKRGRAHFGGPKELGERASGTSVIMALTLPVWLPLFFVGLFLYGVGVLVVLAVRFAWDLVRFVGDDKHPGHEKLLALAILAALLYGAYEVATIFVGG